MIEYNIKILLKNNIDNKKVRFVFNPVFNYDIDNDEINPKLNILLPMLSDGRFDNTKSEINLENRNIKKISVDSYEQNIKDNSNKGFVFFIANDKSYNPITKKESDYKFMCDTDIIRYVNLDNEV